MADCSRFDEESLQLLRASLADLFEPDEAAALVARVDEQVAGTCGYVWSPEAGTYQRAAQEPPPEPAAVSQETSDRQMSKQS